MPNRRESSLNSFADDWKSLWESDLEAIGGFNGATCDPTRVDPKVLDWVRGNCGNEPRFIKIINKNAAHGQPGLLARSSACLSVPGPFVEKHFRDLQRVVTLEKNGEPGQKWKVAFVTASQHPIWLQGWRHVARDNNLKPGDVVVFELLRSSYFRFTLFDEEGNIQGHNVSTNSTCQNDAAPRARRELSYASQSQHELSSAATESGRGNARVTRNRVILSDDSDTETGSPASARPNSSPLGHRHLSPAISSDQLLVPKPELDVTPATPAQKRRKLQKLADKLGKATPGHTSDCEAGSGIDSWNHGTKSPSDSFNPHSFTVSSRRRPVTDLERQRAMDLAEAHTRGITNPHFLVVMSETHVYQRFQLMLPDEFVRKAGFPATGCRMTLEDCARKRWELHGRENANFQVGLIRKGWALFALEHLLEEGDVCVFELADRGARSILVHIFRVVQIPEVCGNISLHDHYELHKKAK